MKIIGVFVIEKSTGLIIRFIAFSDNEVEQAEAKFAEIIKSKGASEEDVEIALEDSFFETEEDLIQLVWS